MAYADYKDDLTSSSFDEIRVLNQYFHSGQSAAFYGAPHEAEPLFKSDLSRRFLDNMKIKLHPLQLIICGSGHLGFSPVPGKLGKTFDPSKSDIDVAIVSTELFESWWVELQSIELVSTVLSKVAGNLFWGFIDPNTVYKYSDLGRKWWDLFGNFQTRYAKSVRGRCYRNYWSMQNYHLFAIKEGRKELLGIRT